MVKTLKYTGLAVLLAASAAIASMFLPASRTPDANVDFPGFAIGDTRRVDFSTTVDLDPAGAYDNPQDRERRKLDQLRDWCLITIIAASNLPAKEISHATYDLPTLRGESLRRITLFEYGNSRSRVVSEHDIIALTPKSSDEARREQLGHIADEQRKNLGEIPDVFHVFEYELAPEGGYATLTRLPAVAGAELFTAAYGYHEREIRTREGLAALLAEIDDLTMARRSGPAIVLGGRRLPSGYAKVGLEEVATIWRGQRGLPEYQGVGFSLDPRLDIEVAQRRFEEDFALPLTRYYGVDRSFIDRVRAILDRPTPKNAQDRAEQAFDFSQALVAACAISANTEQCLRAISSATFDSSYQVARYEGNGLAGTEVGMVLFYTDLLMKLWSFDFEGAAPRVIPGFPIQSEMRLSPVYRGDVERAPSTRLWLEPLDRGYQVTGGRESIFFARTATRLSARAHNFLAGGDEDFEPNVFERVFIDWWNDHYDEVARHEPQFQRLNEITKWGVVMAWLDVESLLPSFSFLSDSAGEPIQVNRNHRLPVWRERRDLTFTGWNKLQFHAPEQARADYESLELLQSADVPYFDGPIVFQGGVSLSSRATIAERAAISGRLGGLEATVRRAGVDTRLTNLSAGRLRTLDATTYEFKNFSQQAVSTLARAKPSARLTDAFGEIENVAFDRTLRRTTDGLRLRTSAQAGSGSRLSGDLGDLRVGRAGRDYVVRWESRDLDLGYSLARRLSVTPDAEIALAADRNIEVAISLGREQGHLLKVRGSDKWIKLSPAPADSRTIAPGYHARVAGVGNDARTVDVAWLDEASARTHLEPTGYLQITSHDAAAGGVRLQCCARAPPSGASRTTLRAGGEEFGVAVDRAGTRFVRLADLPASVRSDLGTLTGAPPRLAGSDARLLRSLKQGEYRQAARELSVDRLEYQARMARIVEYEIRLQRTLADPQVMLAHIDETIRTLGATPELSASKALIHVQNGNAEAATSALNATRGPAAPDVQRIVAEAIRVAPARTPLESANQTRVLQWMRWQQVQTKSGEIAATAGREGRITLELRVRRFPDGDSLSAAQVSSGLADRNALVYIHDSPALNNIDVFTSSGRQSLQQLVAGRRVTVRELELNDVARFRPALIRDVEAQSASYRRASNMTRLSAQRLGNSSSSLSRLDPPDDDDDEPDDEESGRSRRVYLIESQM